MIRKKNLQVIGACVEMQKISLEEEMQLIDGIPFDIDFSQDFSKVCLNGHTITNMAISEIVAYLASVADTENVPVPYDTNNHDSGITQWKFNEMLEKCEKENRKTTRKWKKDKKKEKSIARNCGKKSKMVAFF